MLTNYKDMFSFNDDGMGFTDAVEHQIDTNGAKPVKQRMRKPHHMAEEADHQVDDMLKRGVYDGVFLCCPFSYEVSWMRS